MMKLYLSLCLVLAVTCLSAQTSLIKLKAADTKFQIISQNETSLKVMNSIAQCRVFTVKHKGKIFSKLDIAGYAGNKDYGYPLLPVYHKLMEIPYGAEIQVEVISFDEETISLTGLGMTNKLFPAQPSLSKSDDPDKVPFHFNDDYYQYDDFNNTVLADVDKLGIMRGVQVGRLSVHPVRYNPVTNTIKIFNNLVVVIKFKNADMVKTNQLRQKYYSPLFDTGLKKLVNYAPFHSKDLITQYPVKYVIVADTMFYDALQPFIQWKTRKGFHVIQAYTSNPAVGQTATSIHNYLQNLYTSATVQDPAPSFILFAGDIAQVPAFTGNAGSHATDLYHCEYDGGGDYFPDVYYGRFSATNVAEIQSQIDKTLEYEQYLMPDPVFLNEVVMIAGVDANYAPIHGNGQINYGTSMYYNATHGLLPHTYLYPGTENSAVSGQIINDVTKGVGFANYTAHGGSDGWSDPSFNNADVATLMNDHKYPLMIGNCCVTNKFDDPACFGETLLRASHKGVYAYIGASNNSYWDEDFWWGTGSKTPIEFPAYDSTKLGSYDCMFHENGEPGSSWYVTNGQMVHAGNLAVAEGGGSIQYYWEIYHLMGDPSAMNYFSVPPALAISYNNALPLGLTSLDITTEPNAYVAISNNNVLLDAKLADNTGIVHLTFPAFTMAGTADLVATKQNRQPYIGTVSIIPNSTPYVAYFSNVINDSAANNNHVADYNENISLTVELKNIGMYEALGVTAAISTSDTNIIITDANEIYGDMPDGASVTKNNAFQFQVKNKIEDQHVVLFDLTATDNTTTTWPSAFSIVLNAPKLKILSVIPDDSQGNGNGRLDPGESAQVQIIVNNYGHAATTLPESYLSTTYSYITLLNSDFPLTVLEPGAVDTAFFNIMVSPASPLASLAQFTFDAIADPYGCQKIFTLPVGMILEDWESNTITHFPWINNSTSPWTIVTDTVYEGSYSLKSGAINDLETSDLILGLNVQNDDSISFYYKVSSEAGYDSLKFYVDGILQAGWEGEKDWGRAAYPVSAGQHALKWTYEKDYSVFEGADCAWIDFIAFPQSDLQTKIENLSGKKEFLVYPTVTSTYTNVIFETGETVVVSLGLYNTLGQPVRSYLKNKQFNAGHQSLQINMQGLSQGVYYLHLNSGNQNPAIKKIIITK